MLDNLLKVSDVAKHLRVSDETVREWLRKNELSGYNFGGRTGWRVPISEVDRLLVRKAGKRPPTNTAATGNDSSTDRD